jgi:hypothetical protein
MDSTKTVQCRSWADFTSQIGDLRGPARSPAPYLFRGHARADWLLRSSLGRLAVAAGLDDLKAVRIQRQLLEDFIRHAHLLLAPSMLADDPDLVHWWTVMQHYGAPTRLLDWTRSPYVALYFAAVDEPSNDGAVWAASESKLRQLTPEAQDLLDKDQRSFFWKTRVRADFAVVDSKRPSERLNAQQGVFTTMNAIVPQHEQFISHVDSANGENDLVKLEIQRGCKTEMLERLREMNVHGLSLFPGIAGAGAMMRDLAVILARRI